MKFLGLVPAALLVAQLPAQNGLREFEQAFKISGEATKDNFGKAICSIGDVNGDLKDDFLVGLDFSDASGISDSGSVYLYSGADGSIIYRLYGVGNGDKFGGAISPSEDLDGDGIKDFVVGARLADAAVANNAGTASVYSGATGVELLNFQGEKTNSFFGIAVAAVGDTDLDGAPDFLIGSRGQVSSGGNEPGKVYLYSGGDGQLIRTINGTAVGDMFGDSLAGLGDVNGDGAADYLVGASGIHSVYLYSGIDGSLIRLWDDFPSTSDAGASISAIADLNGDDLADVLIGDPASLSVHIFETGNGKLLGTLSQSATYGQFGGAVSSAGDIDQDGKEDILVGAIDASPAGTKTGSAFIYSSASGAQLHRFDGDTDLGKFGCSVSMAGDLNRDGLPDLIIGSRHGDHNGIDEVGYVEVYLTRHYMALNSIGQAPGPVQLEATFTNPDDLIAFFYGLPGSSTIPIPGCGMVGFDLAAPKLDRIYQAGPTGRVNFSVVVPPSLVGWGIQGLNVDACETSNAVQF